jgi:hypothetical protein
LPCALLLELRLEPLEDLILLLDLPCALLLDLGVALLLDLPCALLLELRLEPLEDLILLLDLACALLDLGVTLLLDLSCAPLLDWGGSLLLDLGDLLDEDDSGDSVESGRASTSSLESGRLSTVSGEALFSMVESAFSVGCSCDMAVSGVALEVESESQPTMVKSGMTIVATEMILEIPI